MNSFNAVAKALTVCFACIFFQQANAQSPVFTDANFSLKKGDVFVFKWCKTNQYDTGVAGAKKTWDYSYLKDSLDAFTHKKVIDRQTCILPSQTSYANVFPNATIATKHTLVPDDHNDFYSGGNFYTYWGYVLADYRNVYSKAEPFTPEYPFKYKSNFFTTSKYKDQSNITYNGKDSIWATGYGTLILPGDTIHNVLMLKQLHIFTSNVGTKTTVESYVFITPGYHAGLLNLSHTKTINVINHSVISDAKFIWYAQNTSALARESIAGNVAEPSMFSVSPNPAKDFITIVSKGNVANAQVTITNLGGRILYTAKQSFIAGQQVKVVSSQFPKDILLVNITSNNKSEQFKIIKE